MIQATDLRINNWVFSEEMIPFKITESSDIDEFKRYEPIELTEEILLKCGFEKSYESEFTITYNHIKDDRFYIKINISSGFMLWFLGVPIKCNYLHQLQNLLFALTGQELEINL